MTSIVPLFSRGDTAAMARLPRFLVVLGYLLALALVGCGVFLQTRYPLQFLLPLPLLLMATQTGFVGVTLAVPVLAIIAFSCTFTGSGPLALNAALSAQERSLLVSLLLGECYLLGYGTAYMTARLTRARLDLRTERKHFRDFQDRLAQDAAPFRRPTDHPTHLTVQPDPPFVTRYLSPACRDLLGYEAETLVATPLPDIVHPDEQVPLAEALRGLTAGGDQVFVTCRLRHRDGRWIWVEADLRRSQATLSGGLLEISGSLRNMTEREAVQHALTKENERLRIATAGAGIGVWDWDIINDRLMWDDQMYRLYGTCTSGQPETLMLWSRYLHPDDRAAAEAALQDYLAGDGPFEADFRIVWDDGSVHHIRAAGHVTRAADGRALRMIGSNWNVTKEVRTEARLREERAQFQLLLEGVVDHAVYLLDVDGKIRTWNPGAARIKGYRAEEAIGQNYAIFFTQDDQLRGEPEHVLQFTRETGRFEGNAWRVRKDGSRFWARVSVTALHDNTGALVGFTKVAQNLTGRQIEETKRAILIEAAPNGMLIVDETGIITLANSQADQIFGYDGGELIGQSIELLVPEALRARHAEIRTAFSQDQQEIVSPTRPLNGRRKDGTDLAVEVMLHAVKTPHGKVVVASVFDATEQRRLQQERDAAKAAKRAKAAEIDAKVEELATGLREALARAEHASEAKSRFLAGISHELRTPLNGILGYAQLLRDEGGLRPSQADYVEGMLGAGQHLLGMINSVLDLSMIESNKVALRHVGVDLPQLARTSLDVVRPAASAKALKTQLNVASDAPSRAFTDDTRLRQVLVNLLGNAVKFTTVGSVELRLLPGRDTGWVRLEVVDTGPGIQAKAKLFQEFERLSADVHGATEGAGLGLAIAAGLTRRMGGEIGHTDNPGGGSVFWVDLPVGIDATEQHSAPAAVTSTITTRNLRILVVDDIEMNRAVAGAFLRNAGYQVDFADSGAEGVRAVETTTYDAVLMDVRMPGMDGLEATRHIRAMPAPRGQVPIIAMTAQAFTNEIEKCRQAGMNLHVSKPIEAPVLLAAIASLISVQPCQSQVDHHASAPDTLAIDETLFSATAAVLPPASLKKHLRALIGQGDALLAQLRSTGAMLKPDELADAAHAFGGAAGTLGFRHLLDAARQFEVAIAAGSSELAPLTTRLAQAIEVALIVLHEKTAVGP